MPVAIGYHPYFQLTDSPRETWTLSVPAKTHWRLDARLLPTGESESVTTVLPDPDQARRARAVHQSGRSAAGVAPNSMQHRRAATDDTYVNSGQRRHRAQRAVHL